MNGPQVSLQTALVFFLKIKPEAYLFFLLIDDVWIYTEKISRRDTEKLFFPI